MKVKLLTDGGFRTTAGSVGKLVEATAFYTGIKVTALELQRVGASKAFGGDYAYFDYEVEVIEDDN